MVVVRVLQVQCGGDKVLDELGMKGGKGMTLYEALNEAKIEMDHHESDLYFELSGRSIRIASQYPQWMKSATTFTSQIEPKGSLWVDVPFAYDPWWQGVKA